MAAALVLASCTKEAPIAEKGNYIARNGNIVISLVLIDNSPFATIFVDGSYVWQEYGILSGEYPNYIYLFERAKSLNIEAAYDSPTTFTATISDNSTGVNLPASLRFKRDDTVLDANGDGKID